MTNDITCSENTVDTIATVQRPSRLRMGENRGFYQSYLLLNSRTCEKQHIKA